MISMRVDESLVAKLLIMLFCLALFYSVAVWVFFDRSYTDEKVLEPVIFALPSPGDVNKSDANDYINANDRPLFWPTRRAVKVEKVSNLEPTLAELSSKNLVLHGVIIASGIKKVFIAKDKKIGSYSLGDKILGWTVKEIRNKSVLLVQSDKELILPTSRDRSDTISLSRVNG